MPKILQKINKTVQFLIGDIDKTSLDRRLLTLLTLTFLIGNIYSLILVYSLNLSSLIKISNLCFVLFFLTFFLLVRFAKTNVNVVNVVLFAVISLFMSYYFIFNNGTYGPIIYFYIMFLIFITGLKYKNAVLYLFIGILNLLVLLFFEYYFDYLLHQIDLI